MVTFMTEDEVRDKARTILEFPEEFRGKAATGQLTTFNQLGFDGVPDKPDGWALPNNPQDTAFILEAKNSNEQLEKHIPELMKNVRIARRKYPHVVGVLYNGHDVMTYRNEDLVEDAAKTLQPVSYYLRLFDHKPIDKARIFDLTKQINDCLHTEFGIKNLYHRMIFTACALVAKRYGAVLTPGIDYTTFTQGVQSTLNKALIHDKKQNDKLNLLADVFSDIKMNLNVDDEDEKQQEHVTKLIGEFIGWITEISDCINSDAWRGEDVMGIFFNEFNRYKAKTEAGQVFTPEHITDFMYRICEVGQRDKVLDAACGSGGFLVKCMANMIREAGGMATSDAKRIKRKQLYGIEFDREIYALACANMLIHKDGKTNLAHMDARTPQAARWISEVDPDKVLMNPPFEAAYGCLDIVENVLDNVPTGTTCAFILPDKKLEKAKPAQRERFLKHHRLCKVVKLPNDLFFGTSVTTSIFVFRAGNPQNDEEFFACYMAEDGLQAVKNKGRQDVAGRWPAIEDYWVDVVKKQSGDATCQWVKPSEHLSYQEPASPFEIEAADFQEMILDAELCRRHLDQKEFEERVLKQTLYGEDA